jgi:hypothetical protein
MLRTVSAHLDSGPRRVRHEALNLLASGELAESEASEVLDVFDPHFHLFDPAVVHSGTRSDGSGFEHYGQADYEADMRKMPTGLFRHVGGCWVEAMSVCYEPVAGPALQPHCVAEAAFVAAELRHSGLQYAFCASVALEDPGVGAVLKQLVGTHPQMRAVRQIANVNPDVRTSHALVTRLR